MLEEVTNIEGLEVFTPWGVRVGSITGVELDHEEGSISGLLAEDTNPNLVEMGAPLLIPFRWIQAVGDVVILRHFPEEVPIPAPSEYGMEEFKE
jgi:sporulation protein YlmC with PRC-barrel domain